MSLFLVKIFTKNCFDYIFDISTIGTIKKQNGQIVECTIKVNKTNTATGFYGYLIYDVIPRVSLRLLAQQEVIYGNLKKDTLNTFGFVTIRETVKLHKDYSPYSTYENG